MTFQLLSCLVIVLVLQFHTQPCQGNPVEDDAATGSDNQPSINEYSKADESVTTTVNPVEDDAASDFDNQTSNIDNESVTAIMDDCIRKFKKINLEGIEGITKEDKNLYKDSLRQFINAKKELQYNRINLETYAEITIDAVDELSRLINEIDSNKKKIEYSSEKMLSLIDESQEILKTVNTSFTDINGKLFKVTSDMKTLQQSVESLKKNIEEEKDENKREFDIQCGWKCWAGFPNNETTKIKEKLDSLTWQMERITAVLRGFSIIPKIKKTNDDVTDQLTSAIKWWVQTSNVEQEMSSKDFAKVDNIYARIQENKQVILSQLTKLKQACQKYISHGMQNKNKGQEVDNAMVSSTDMKNISASQ